MYGPATGSSPARLIGRSPLIVAARKAIARLARLDTPVLRPASAAWARRRHRGAGSPLSPTVRVCARPPGGSPDAGRPVGPEDVCVSRQCPGARQYHRAHAADVRWPERRSRRPLPPEEGDGASACRDARDHTPARATAPHSPRW